MNLFNNFMIFMETSSSMSLNSGKSIY